MLARPSVAAATVLFACHSVFHSGAARSETTGSSVALSEVVVTADRVPEPIQRSGSAISVITREQLQTFNATSPVDALRNVPGLDITETGGPGATTNVRLRGANPGQTLVLIDGIRVNDPSGASGDFDFATLLPTAIERIEVLRGPQSALYGSDAIGGVVNIITRAGGGEPHGEFRTEAGQYGTITSSATAFGSSGPWSYSFSGGGQGSEGFSRYGYRIGQLERKFGSFEPDGFTRYGGYGRLGYDAGQGVKFEIGVLSFTQSDYAASSSTLPRLVQATGPTRIFPDTPSAATRELTQIFARATAEQGPLTQSLRVYANETDRTNEDVSYRTNQLPRNTTDILSEFLGRRVGTEYQGDLRFGTFGTLTFGGRAESESASTYSTSFLPTARPRVGTLKAEQDTRSVFALYQLPIEERLILSLGGRHDEVAGISFDTWRASAAYLIPESGTKLRASGGTGGKAPTLFQLFSPVNGTATLQPETSIGWDAGIDQILFDGRLTASATVFANKLDNLINFDSVTQRYFNTARAETSGLELEGTAILWPDFVRLTGAYTYLHAVDLATHLTLQRRPEHVGRIGLGLTPLPGWLIEPRVTVVARRFSGNNETQPLPGYGRLDVYSEYRIDGTWKVFGRIENVTDTRYQEVLNYGTTGRALYAGFSLTW